VKQIFGADAQYVSVVAGAGSLQNASTDPLDNVDVIFNAVRAGPRRPTPRHGAV